MAGFRYEIADRLLKARKQARLTQAELARKVGVTVQCISSYEIGRTMPNAERVSQLASALGVKADAIVPTAPVAYDGVVVPCSGHVPVFKHVGDAGADVRSSEDLVIEPGRFAQVHTGLRIALPCGYVGLLFARSGTGLRGIGITHGVGVIDAGYRGEVSACLHNMGDRPFEVRKGDRVAQLVVMPIPKVMFNALDPDEFADLGKTERGTSGYGSTGRD